MRLNKVCFLAFSASLLILWGCPNPTTPAVDPWQQVTKLTSVTLDGSKVQDVFLVLTNNSGADLALPPVISTAPEDFHLRSLTSQSFMPSVPTPSPYLDLQKWKFTPEKKDPAGLNRDLTRDLNLVKPSPPSADAVGNSLNFNGSDTNDVRTTVNATIRLVRSVSTAYGPKQLTIAVSNIVDAQNPTHSATTNLVTQPMVNAIADKFLFNGAGNDIYDWETQIYGPEWGPDTTDQALIDTRGVTYLPSDEAITILILPLSPPLSTGNPFTLGYFSGADIWKASESNPYSNERRMFYINSVPLSQSDENQTWDIKSYYPELVISTLAHEFQHMLEAYHRWVLRGIIEPAWLNEMMSMATEDLLADKLEISGITGYTGPQGKALVFSDLKSQKELIQKGRMNAFLGCPNWSLGEWKDDSKTILKNYALHGALGAFLLRNYGGAALVRDVMNSSQTGLDNLTAALNAHKGAGAADVTSFKDILALWAQALVTSHLIKEPADGLTLNRGGWFTSDLEAASGAAVGTPNLTYQLASLNAFTYNYLWNAFLPIIWYKDWYPANIDTTFHKDASLYLRVGYHMTESFNLLANLPAGVDYKVYTVDPYNPSGIILPE